MSHDPATRTDPSPTDRGFPTMPAVVRHGAAVLLLAGLLAAVLAATPWLVAGLRWVEAAGPAGHLMFVGLYVVCSVMLVPASILEAAAGFLYGPILGVPVASLLGTLGASVSFLLGRTLLRRRVEARVARDPRWAAMDRAVGERGAELVFWLRLSPLAPFNALHLPLGLTRISLPAFAAATALGHLFPVVAFVFTGATVDSLTDLAQGRPAPPMWASIAGLLLTVVATVAVTRLARRVVDRATEPS